MGSSELGPIYRRTGHPSSCRPRHGDRVGKRRSEEPPLTVRIRRRHTTETLSAVLAHRGTDGSNPLSSSRQSVSLRISPSFLEKPGFSASVGRMPDGAVGRDAQVQQHRAEEPVVSLSGDIPVPHCRRCGSRRWGYGRQARLGRSRFSNIERSLEPRSAQTRPSTVR